MTRLCLWYSTTWAQSFLRGRTITNAKRRQYATRRHKIWVSFEEAESRMDMVHTRLSRIFRRRSDFHESCWPRSTLTSYHRKSAMLSRRESPGCGFLQYDCMDAHNAQSMAQFYIQKRFQIASVKVAQTSLVGKPYTLCSNGLVDD